MDHVQSFKHRKGSDQRIANQRKTFVIERQQIYTLTRQKHCLLENYLLRGKGNVELQVLFGKSSHFLQGTCQFQRSAAECFLKFSGVLKIAQELVYNSNATTLVIIQFFMSRSCDQLGMSRSQRPRTDIFSRHSAALLILSRLGLGQFETHHLKWCLVIRYTNFHGMKE